MECEHKLGCAGLYSSPSCLIEAQSVSVVSWVWDCLESLEKSLSSGNSVGETEHRHIKIREDGIPGAERERDMQVGAA